MKSSFGDTRFPLIFFPLKIGTNYPERKGTVIHEKIDSKCDEVGSRYLSGRQKNSQRAEKKAGKIESLLTPAAENLQLFFLR